MTDHETAAEVEQAALTWLWRRESSDWSPEMEGDLRHWLAASSARQGAFIRAEAAWASLDRLTWGEALPQKQLAPDRRLLLGGIFGAAAAAAAGLMLLGRGEHYVSPDREIRSVGLRDGSALMLNADTDLRADMEGRQRNIDLKQGEAFFKVHPDHERPFIVAAGKLRVRAVGTAFSIIHRGDQSRVVVTEGVVETWLADAPEKRIRLSAGQVADLGANASAIVPMRSDGTAERQMAWRYGRIDLDGETLSEAAELFNRYNQVNIVVTNKALAKRRLYGIFDAHDPSAFARTAALSLGASVRTSGDEIHIGGRTDN